MNDPRRNPHAYDLTTADPKPWNEPFTVLQNREARREEARQRRAAERRARRAGGAS